MIEVTQTNVESRILEAITGHAGHYPPLDFLMRVLAVFGVIPLAVAAVFAVCLAFAPRRFRMTLVMLAAGALSVTAIWKLETILGNNVFYDVGDETTYIWQNTYDKRSRKAEFDLTFFVRDDEQYRRYDEIHYERAYAADEIKGLLEKAGMHLLNQYDELSFVPPGGKSERIFFVAVKE
jgi:hypothetical protein